MIVLAKAWLVTLAMTAGQGTVLAALAFAVTRAGRLRPAWQAAIWLVVTIKLAVPWGPALPWSLADLWSSLTPGGEVVASGPPALQPVAAPHLWAGWLVLAAVWAVGAMFVLFRALAAQRRASRAARCAPRAPVPDAHVVIGDPGIGPHVVGGILWRPIIVVPPALLDDPVLLRAALRHELAHVRRRDALGRLVQIVAAAMMWWWPVARLVGRQLDAAREAACDAWALEAGDVPRPAYARLLVRMAALRSAAAPGLASPHALDARIAAVLGPARHARIGGVHRLALAAWIALALGGARSATAGDHATCAYTPQLAASLYLAHPEADLDGDGTLSRDEACELQAELRRHADETSSPVDVETETLLSEPLCCNCDRPGGLIPGPEAICREGVDR